MENNENKGLAIVPKLAQLDHASFAKDLITAIKEGQVDPLMAHIFLKRIEKIQDILKDDKEVKELIKTEASKHELDGKTFAFMGAKLQLTSVHTAYKFEECNDILWTNLNEIFERVKAMKTERETFLKAAFPEKSSLFGVVSPKVVIDQLYTLEATDCGEEVTLNAPVKYQQQGVKVTFPKI